MLQLWKVLRKNWKGLINIFFKCCCSWVCTYFLRIFIKMNYIRISHWWGHIKKLCFFLSLHLYTRGAILVLWQFLNYLITIATDNGLHQFNFCLEGAPKNKVLEALCCFTMKGVQYIAFCLFVLLGKEDLFSEAR